MRATDLTAEHLGRKITIGSSTAEITGRLDKVEHSRIAVTGQIRTHLGVGGYVVDVKGGDRITLHGMSPTADT